MDNNDFPLISTIMLAGHNSLNEVKAGIQCFESQTYPNKELIIVNNCPTQAKASELWIKKIGKTVQVVDTPYYLSAGMARNWGISAANGTILCQFDANYWYDPSRLEVQVSALVKHEVNVVMLAKTLQYSYISGRASYYTNKKSSIMNTMMCVRPKDIDYGDVEKNEEFSMIEKFVQANAKIISVDAPMLACRFHFAKKRVMTPKNYGLSKDHFAIVKRIVK